MNARQSVIIAMFLTMAVFLLAHANAMTLGGSIERNLAKQHNVGGGGTSGTGTGGAGGGF